MYSRWIWNNKLGWSESKQCTVLIVSFCSGESNTEAFVKFIFIAMQAYGKPFVICLATKMVWWFWGIRKTCILKTNITWISLFSLSIEVLNSNLWPRRERKGYKSGSSEVPNWPPGGSFLQVFCPASCWVCFQRHLF